VKDSESSNYIVLEWNLNPLGTVSIIQNCEPNEFAFKSKKVDRWKKSYEKNTKFPEWNIV
jgi:hypothetical protein